MAHRTFTTLLAVYIIGTPTWSAARSVPCDAPVQSPKRGLAVQGNDYPTGMELTQSDLDVLAPGVSWYYNWAASTSVLDSGERMEFLPMAWGHDGDNAAVATWLAAHPSTSIVLTANEPNLAGQADMTVGACVDFMEGTVAIAGNRPVIGPHLAAGAGPTEYRNSVHQALSGGLRAAAIHVYETNEGGFSYWATQWPHTNWPGSPAAPTEVWMKEFNFGGDDASEQTVIDYMIYAVDLMERDARVSHYAWWKDRRRSGGPGFTKPPTHFILSNTTNGALTKLGALYVAMPVHDPDLYYTLPGVLQAERYRSISGFNPPGTMNGNVRVTQSTDSNGALDVSDLDSGEWVELNVDVPTAGAWTVQVRGSRATTGTSTILVKEADTVLATVVLERTVAVTVDAGAYVTSDAVTLDFATPGTRTLRLIASADTTDTSLNWIKFVSPDGDDGEAPSEDGGSDYGPDAGCTCRSSNDNAALFVVALLGMLRRRRLSAAR